MFYYLLRLDTPDQGDKPPALMIVQGPLVDAEFEVVEEWLRIVRAQLGPHYCIRGWSVIGSINIVGFATIVNLAFVASIPHV